MIKAAIYARFSSDNQREESITAQIRACSAYCNNKKYVIAKTYTDEAKSAMSDNRPEFQRMINDAKAGLFDVVIVHKLDRFARNRYDSAFYRRELKMAGVHIESVLERLDDSPESVLMESLLEGLAEYYSKNLAREAMKGMKETALQAKHCGGIPPLGFNVNTEKRYVINEREAAAVRLIFSMYDSGFGYSKIIDELESKGHKTKTGKKFGKNSIHELLKNEKYIGVYTFNKRASRGADGKKNNRRQKSEEEIIRIPGAMPAIIDLDVFERVQQRMINNRRHSEKARGKAKVNYLLTGLVRCGNCGASYIGHTITRGGVGYGYYECGNRDRKNECSNRRIKKDLIENAVINEIEESIFKNKEELAEMVLEYYNKHKGNDNAEKDCLEEELKKVKKTLDNLVKAIESGRMSEVILTQIEKREEELNTLKSRIAELDNKDGLNLGKKEIVAYLEALHKQMENEEQLKSLVNTFVDSVTVGTADIVVVLKVLVTDGGGGAYPTVTKTVMC